MTAAPSKAINPTSPAPSSSATPPSLSSTRRAKSSTSSTRPNPLHLQPRIPECNARPSTPPARNIITAAGYGPDYKHFTHRLGHGIGMDGHEWPYLVRGNTTPLAPGMCFSDEPGIYITDEFGIRLEDDWHVTEDGGKMFTPQSPSLEHPFATS